MKYAFAVSLIVLLAGCASDAEDRAFFNRGWMAPEKGAEARLNQPFGESLKTPSRPSSDDGADRPAL